MGIFVKPWKQPSVGELCYHRRSPPKPRRICIVLRRKSKMYSSRSRPSGKRKVELADVMFSDGSIKEVYYNRLSIINEEQK